MRELSSSNVQGAGGPVSEPAILIAALVVAALYFGRDVLIPIALAVLLSFVLSPLVGFLERWYFPRSVAVTVVALLAFAAILGLGALMVSEADQLAGDLPRYQSTLREKIQSLRGAAAGSRTVERASEVLQNLSKEIDKPNTSSFTTTLAGRAPPNRPIPVELKQSDLGALQTLAALIAPLIHAFATTGIVAIFVIFILVQRQDLRNRLVRLAGGRDIARTTAALDDAGRRLSRLFLRQLAVNAAFGLVIATGLRLIGVPNAFLWGMLAAIMGFVPYVGVLISAMFPLVLAASVGPGWTMVLLTGALFLIAEAVFDYVITPLVEGHSTSLSPVAIVASATFWVWLWGPIGLILATPLTMCLVVAGRHVDRLKFLEVMFGDQPPLAPAELIYQRMLARDPVEAVDQAQIFLREKPLISYYDEILLEGLKLAQEDAERGLLDEERMQRIRDVVAEIIDDLSPHKDKVEPELEPDAKEQSPLGQLVKAEVSGRTRFLPERWRMGKPVLCVPGLGLLDEAVAMIVAQLVERQGIGAQSERADALSMSRIFSMDTKDVALVCLCYLENATPAQIRYAIRRVRRRAPDVFIVVALLGGAARIDSQDTSKNTDFVEPSLQATVDKILAVANSSFERQHRPELPLAPVTN
jgi:predicted PurR-regulated permease PerM